jgi:hypothetical protein
MDAELQQAWNELAEGTIAYEPSRVMREGQSEIVLVRIARGDTIDAKSGFVDQAWVERLKVSGFMTAALNADPGEFEIVSLSSDAQALVGPSTEWTWRVTPLRDGDLSLSLRITARIRLSDGSSENHDLPVKTARISVRADRWWRTTQFWERNWQWLLGSPIVLGFLGWAGARLVKRRRSRKRGGARR